MSVGRDPVGDGLQSVNNQVGTNIKGATEGTGPVQGVRGGYGSGILGGAHNGTVWASGRGKTKLENLGKGG